MRHLGKLEWTNEKTRTIEKEAVKKPRSISFKSPDGEVFDPLGFLA
jgi:hypothetical protein